jgi:GNAT superfamily N-acetyltransferase
MIQIMHVDPVTHREAVAALFTEYLTWLNHSLQISYGFGFDVATAMEDNLHSLEKFLPPHGRMLLARASEDFAGIACLRLLNPNVCEVKRMFVRPSYRGQGIGRTLLQALLDEAGAQGFTSIRLDSARFMLDAHALYRSFGFTDIPPYRESEVPPQLHADWLFMARPLNGLKTPIERS